MRDKIGRTMARRDLQDLAEVAGRAEVATAEGHYEAALDDLLGWPVTTSSNPWGDWDISVPMIDYYNWSGTCGY